jgi:hypothetical protein
MSRYAKRIFQQTDFAWSAFDHLWLGRLGLPLDIGKYGELCRDTMECVIGPAN